MTRFSYHHSSLLAIFITGLATLTTPMAVASEALSLTPWLDIPVSWNETVENGVVVVVPGDLSHGESLILMIEPLSTSNLSLDEDYEQALRDLAAWTPAGKPVQQRFDNGWVFQLGVGVVTLNGSRYTTQTVVARNGSKRVRFWELADSDNTFNRYKSVVGNAIASAQDITLKPAVNAQRDTPASAPATGPDKPDPAFGKGVSGVYVGLERGLSASAGLGAGQQQIFNQSSGRFETSNTGTSQQIQTRITDYMEVDVFYPDGNYEDRGGFLRMIGSAWNLVVPDGSEMVKRWSDAEAAHAMGGGSGAYTFDHFTLTLHDRDGRTWQFNAYVPPGDNLPKPQHLVISGRALVRD